MRRVFTQQSITVYQSRERGIFERYFIEIFSATMSETEELDGWILGKDCKREVFGTLFLLALLGSFFGGFYWYFVT